MAIGDTTHFHLLKTTRNDQFIGKVMSWTPDSMVFLTSSEVRISFPPSEVRSIEVTENQQLGSPNVEIFILETTDGKMYYGYPKQIQPDRITFVAGGNVGLLRFRPENVLSIEPTSSMSLMTMEPFINEYCLQSKANKKVTGEMLGYSGGRIQLLDADGKLVNESVENLRKYELCAQYTPYLGYGRSLMFLPTGFGMEDSQREYRNIALGINILSFGISDHVSVGTGLVSILPYADIKYSQDFGKYVHWSIGGYAFVPSAIGIHGAISLGTHDYFLNLSYLRNFDIKSLDTDSDFESFSVGASLRTGRRSRLFAEYNIMVAPVSTFGGYESFYEHGFGNMFTWGYGWFKRKFRLETGIMGIGPFTSYYCFPEECERTYHVPIPFFAFSFYF
ncbi:MAG: hypothetical protein IPM82_01665 [Saprospiraceae bacterium]|nr:hypothetical protein [Saprospiraceae bacterium]